MFLFFLQYITGFSQNLDYVHYGPKEGLAGNTVYGICEDADGFLWFATENGLSRYDGTRFTNFTVSNGMPDNEVLKIFADSRGRLWIGTYNKQLSYYYQGKIHTRENDSLLSRLELSGIALFFNEDKEGNILISDNHGLYKLTPDGKLVDYLASIGLQGDPNRTIIFEYYPSTDELIIAKGDSTFDIRNGVIHGRIYTPPGPADLRQTVVRVDGPGRFKSVALPADFISQTYQGKSVTYIATLDGAWATDTVTNKLDFWFLPGKKISKVLEDKEKNLWFSTLGEGVYKLPSRETRTVRFDVPGPATSPEVYSLQKNKGNIICGLGYSKAAVLSSPDQYTILDYKNHTPFSRNNISYNRLFCSKTLSSGALILGYDSYIIKLENNKVTLRNIVAIKSIDEAKDGNILVGTAECALLLNPGDFSVIDTIRNERCTSVLYIQDKYYVSTLNGLYEITTDHHARFLGAGIPILRRRINDMVAGPDGMIWVATSDKGVAGYFNEKLVTIIDEKAGLTSNICKSVSINGAYLWVGTNKGINKINIATPGYPVLKYGAYDGLPSEMVNDILLDDSTVWVASPAGVTYFNEHKLSNTSICRLKLLQVQIPGGEFSISPGEKLAYNQNNVSFEYVAISFKSAGDITYFYKLEGLGAGWQQTTQNTISYQSLPPGSYTLKLYAVNKFGLKSEELQFQFSIATPFWKSWWFYVLILAGSIVFTVWMVNKRNLKIRSGLEEKGRFQRQLASVEQQALLAQMNPHFIFNCLNAIQQYILTNNKELANQYLSAFASLIRQTLDNSGKQSITVAEEVKYLSQYLGMEQLRFGDSFIYEIKVLESVETGNTKMPAMLLQPFIENALRHGIRNKTEGIGKVVIIFHTNDDLLTCTITDNGIGRELAGTVKSRQHIEYQSKGIQLTEKRVALLNKIEGKKISIEITDLSSADGSPTGTEVQVKIPA